MLLSYEIFLHGDKLDHDGTPIGAPDPADIADTDSDEEPPDPADIADADAFEELAQNNHFVATRTPDQLAIDESPNTLDAPEELPNDMEAGNTDVMPTVVINHFPLTSAGAPIHGVPHSNSVYESQWGTDRESIWSPFTSKCDWLFARWAKMHGPTSSAVTELLAIPEVRSSLCYILTLLI
jgi:hypothetical protein